MSSANGSQNLFTNIFRPVYRYEIPTGGSTAIFTPAVDVCNIDVISANSISGFTAAIGDENENVYVGSNAGNDYSNLRGCSNVTAVGYAAANLVSNVKNSVYVGYNSGAGAADSSVNVAIGPETKGNGISNIYIGSNTGSLGTGFNNILIGHNLTGTNLSNTLLIGPTPTIYGNLSTRKVGIGRDPSYNMDVSGDSRISYRLGVGMAPGSAVGLSNVPHALDVSGFSYINGALGINADPADYTMNVNGRFNVDDGNGSLRLTSDGCGNSVIEARPRAGKNLVFNIQGDLCATAIIIPGASYTGNVTASNLIASNDLSGPTAHVTNIYGNTVYGTDVSGATARFGTLYASTFNPAAISVAVLTAGNGSVSTPSLTFSGDASAGLYLPSASNVAFTTAGVERMRISNAFVGIGTNVPRSALDVSTNIRAGTPGNTTNTARLEVGGGYDSTGAAVTNSYPTLAFQYGDSAGGYRHFVRTRHTAVTGDAGNGIDIFTNNSTTATGSTAPGTSNLLGLSITSAGVGVGMSNPTIALDVSGGIRSTTAAISAVGGVILSNNNISNTGTTRSSNFIGTAGAASNNIGGITLSNTTLAAATVRNAEINWTTDISGGIVDTSSAIVANFLRNARTATLFDISGGNISNSGTHIATTFRNSNSNWTTDISRGIVDTSSAIVANFLRNARTATLFDISGGNISNSGAHIATTFRNAASAWTIDISAGNVRTGNGTVSNPAISFVSDASAGIYRVGASQLGVAIAGVQRMVVDTSSIRLGQAFSTTDTATLELGGGYQGSGASTTLSFPAVAFQYGDTTTGAYRHFIRSRHDGALLSSNNAVDIFTNNSTTAEGSSGPGTSNMLAMSLTSAGVGVGLSNPGAALDVSGVVRATTNATTGMVTNFLRNALVPSTFDISGGNISNSATTRSSNFIGITGASNIIGGVVLSNGDIRSDASDTFVVGVGTGTATIGSSVDGITWTGGGNPFTTNGNGVAWNGNLWVAVGVGTNSIATSSNGTSWTGAGLGPFSTGGNGVAWGNGLWVAVGAGTTNSIATSTDGTTWSGLGLTIFSTGGNKVAYNGSRWIAVGAGTNSIATSVDGSNWTGLGTSMFTTGTAIAWNGKLWVAGGTGGANTIATSPDGITWTGRGSTTFSHTRAVAWNGSLWVGVGESTNTIATSTDGITWTGQLATTFTVRGYGIAWNGSLWVAFGEGGNRVVTSPDGSNWTGRTPGSIFTTRALGVAARRYVLPLIDSVILDASGGNIEFTGAIVGSNAAANNVIGGVVLTNSNVETGDGTVSAPAYSFISDASAGLYLAGANQLRFTTAGVSRMVISNTNVGIGTTVPYGALDISGQGSTIYVGATANTNGLIIQGYSNSAYIRPQLSGSTLYLGASNSNTVSVTAAYVGINKTPVYALDISASPGTAASIQMNTWPRTTASVSYYGVYSAIVTNAITWSTCNAIDSNLITVGSNNGTYFTVNRSGIYSINAYVNVGAVNFAIIDVSTSASHTSYNYLTMPQLAFASTCNAGQVNVTYTGFLPSNTNNYYKIKASAITAAQPNYNTARIYITFLGEAPTVTGIPY